MPIAQRIGVIKLGLALERKIAKIKRKKLKKKRKVKQTLPSLKNLNK